MQDIFLGEVSLLWTGYNDHVVRAISLGDVVRKVLKIMYGLLWSFH